MHLKKGEYTTNSLISYLTEKFGTKFSGEEFNHSDIAQYCLRGYLPYRYGGHKITFGYTEGIKIITLEEPVGQRAPVKKKKRGKAA